MKQQLQSSLHEEPEVGSPLRQGRTSAVSFIWPQVPERMWHWPCWQSWAPTQHLTTQATAHVATPKEPLRILLLSFTPPFHRSGALLLKATCYSKFWVENMNETWFLFSNHTQREMEFRENVSQRTHHCHPPGPSSETGHCGWEGCTVVLPTKEKADGGEYGATVVHSLVLFPPWTWDSGRLPLDLSDGLILECQEGGSTLSRCSVGLFCPQLQSCLLAPQRVGSWPILVGSLVKARVPKS